MSRVEQIEERIQELSPDEIDALRRWFIAFDEQRWDAQIQADTKSGKLDSLIDRALEDHKGGRSTSL